MSSPLRVVPVLLLAAAAIVVSACEGAPSASGLREWTAADHDRAEQQARAAQGQAAPQPKQPSKAPGNAPGPRPTPPDPLIEATWAQQCASCHGPTGHGDGPTGPMVHARDLTLADWQGTVSDAQLAATIVSGKGKMPPFPDLPARVVNGLVGRIRASRGR